MSAEEIEKDENLKLLKALRTHFIQKLEGKGSDDDSEEAEKNHIENSGNQLGNKTEADFIGTQKKLEAIELLEKNKGDSNNPTFLREELSRTLYMLANESIEKERVQKKNDTIEKIRQAQKKRESTLKSQLSDLTAVVQKQQRRLYDIDEDSC